MKLIFIIFLMSFLPLCLFSQSNVVINWMQDYPNCAIENPNSLMRCQDRGFLMTGIKHGNNPPGCIDSLFYGFVAKTDSIGNQLWVKYLSSGFSPGSGINSAVEVDSGNFVLTGFDHQAKTLWLLKIDSAGNILWEHHYGTINFNHVPSGKSLKRTYDGGFIVAGQVSGSGGDVTTAYGNMDYWIIKTDSAGILLWEKSLGGSGMDMICTIVQTADSGFVVGGSTYSGDFNITNPHGDLDIRITRLDQSGNLIWEKSLGGSDAEIAYNIIETNDGNILIAGATRSNDQDISILNGFADGWIIKVDMNGNILWEKTIGQTGTAIEIFDIKENAPDTFYFTGRIYSFSSSAGNMIFGEISNNTNVTWYEKVLLSSILRGNNLVIDNNITISGYQGNGSYFLMDITPDCNTISGQIFLDLNFNSIHDPNEPFLSNHHVTEINTGRSIFSEPNGQYFINVADTGNFTVQPNSLNYFNAVPGTQSVNFPVLNTSSTGNDFALQPVGVFNDLKIVLTPFTQLRRGFMATLDLQYKNVGTTAISTPEIRLFLDPVLTYQNSTLQPYSVTIDSIRWQLPTLEVFEEGHIQVNVLVNANAVLGSFVSATARIEPILNDNIPGNNFSSIEEEITGSFDPNDIAVNYDTIYLSDPVTHELEYLIRFQNTGNDTAFTVEVVTPVSPLLDFNHFELTATSHPASIAFNAVDRNFRVRFDNILLPDSGTNQAGSNGYIRFKIKPVNAINVGDTIQAIANIYFDFNAPVETNTATSVVMLNSGVHQLSRGNTLLVYPNPVTQMANVNITLQEKSPVDMLIYNSTGQLVKRISQGVTSAGTHKLEFSTAELEKGIYLLRIITSGGVSSSKFIRN